MESLEEEQGVTVKESPLPSKGIASDPFRELVLQLYRGPARGHHCLSLHSKLFVQNDWELLS